MSDSDHLILQVQPTADSDVEELAALTARLRSELLDLDVESVDPLTEHDAPDDAKGIGAIAGLLAVRLGTVQGLRAVLGVITSWAARTNRTVEVSYGDDVLKVTGVTSQQQGQIIDAWLARQASSA
jgi:hypothetical protein